MPLQGQPPGSACASAAPAAPAAHRHTFHGQFERRTGAHGFDLVGAFLQVLAGNGPAVSPQQRADIQHAGAAPVQVGFVVQGELLHAVAEIEQAEMTGADHTAAGADEQLSAALDHVDALVVEEGTGHFLRAAHADVVAGVGAAAATAVRGQQVIPAIVIDHVGRFAVDGEVAGLVVGVEALARLGIELDQPDVAEIGAVDQPQPAVVGIQKDARVDGIAVFDAVRRGDHAAFFPLVVGRIRVEGLAPDHVDRGFGLRPDVRGDIHVVAVADVNDVGGQPAARERGPASPGPAVVGDQGRAAGAVGVEFAVAPHDRGGVVDSDLAVQRKDQRSQRENCCQKSVFHRNSGESSFTAGANHTGGRQEPATPSVPTPCGGTASQNGWLLHCY